MIVGVIYRPPDTDMKIFNENIEEILSKINTENKITYFLGDFNINILNIDKHNETHDFTDIMFSASLLPTITKPTRVTSRSVTLIDNGKASVCMCVCVCLQTTRRPFLEKRWILYLGVS